ncbi:MAG: MalY/PatB family protein [Saprospiraceae bacterium]
MKYNFDQIIDRSNTNAMSVEGYQEYLFAEIEQLNLPCPPEDLISMWIADMEFTTSPEIIRALKERVEHGIFGYSQIFDSNYEKAFLEWTTRRYGWSFDFEHLVTSNGVIPALFALIDYICKPDEKVLIVTPSYAFFKHAADHNNRELITSDLIRIEGEYFMDFADLATKAADEKVKLCIFCSPHNPTGRIWTDAELKQFAEICFEHNLMIISDEIHCDLLRKGKTFTPLAKLFPQSDQIITCMAPSKTFNLAGFMLANIIIPNDDIRNLWKEKQLPIDNPLSIVAAQTAYTEGQNWLTALTDYLDENFLFLSTYLEKYLPVAVFHIPDATYLAWVDVSAYFHENENLTLFFAEQAGVLLEGGNMFVDNSDGYIRLNLACPKSRLKIGLERITKAINLLQKRD